jgi:hypothetical protein
LRVEKQSVEVKDNHIRLIKEKKDEISLNTGIMHGLDKDIETFSNHISEAESKADDI